MRTHSLLQRNGIESRPMLTRSDVVIGIIGYVKANQIDVNTAEPIVIV